MRNGCVYSYIILECSVALSERKESNGRFLLIPLFGSKAKFIVPFLPETTYKRLLKKLIDRQMQFFSEHSCTMAHIPTMILKSRHSRY